MSHESDPEPTPSERPAASPLDSLERESALRPLLILSIPMILLVLYGIFGD
jgi:hypothetical protein